MDGSDETYPEFYVEAVISTTGTNNNYVSCIVPPAPATTILEGTSSAVGGRMLASSVDVGFMNDADTWVTILTAMSFFTYDEDEAVLTPLHPSSFFAGGHERVVITGNGFKATDSLSCLFGGSSMTLGKFLTTTQIECIVSPHQPGLTKVQISLNGVDFYDSYLFVDVLPALGTLFAEPEVFHETGGSLVTLIGHGFSDSPLLSVKLAGVVSHAHWVSHSELKFRAPALDSSTLCKPIEVFVSNNGLDFVNGMATVRVVKQPSIVDATPRRGSTTGGTTISLSGNGFDACKDSLECRFFFIDDDNASSSSNNIDFMDKDDPVISTTPVVHINDTSAMCVTPGNISQGRSRVTVALKGNHHLHASSSLGYNNPFTFVFEKPIKVVSLCPQAIVETGGETVIIRGTDFPDGSLFCSFEGHVPRIVLAEQLNNSAITCVAPAGLLIGPVKISVSMNAIDWVTATPSWLSSLFCHKAIIVSTLLPDKGPIQGGTHLKVIGSGFQMAEDRIVKPLCRFGGNVDTLLIPLSDTEAICPSPPLHDVLPSLLLDGGQSVVTSVSFKVVVDYHLIADRQEEKYVSSVLEEHDSQRDNTGILFSYYYQPEISSLSPNFGSAEGGTAVAISVDRLDTDVESVFIRFGGEEGISTSAIVLANRTILATTPRPMITTVTAIGGSEEDDVPSYIQVQISLNSVDYSKQDVHFTLVQHPVVLNAMPNILNSLGGTTVNVITRFFENYGGDIVCQFGFVPPVSGTFVSPEHLVCVAPLHPPGPSKLKISINGGQDWIMSDITVNVYSPIRVGYIGPHSGPTHGGTMVEIESNTYFSQDIVQCVFGGVVVDAVYVSNSNNSSQMMHQICEYPAFDDTMQYAIVNRSSSTVDIDSEEEVVVEFQLQSSTNMLSYLLPEPINYFTYYAGEERVEQITPGHGPVEGGTLLKIIGGKFHYSPLLSCQFTGAGESTVVPAEWQSSTLVICVTPPGTIGIRYEISVAAKGADFAPSGVSYLYLWSGRGGKAVILPKSGPTKGGTSILIKMDELSLNQSRRTTNSFEDVLFFNTDDLSCRFGSLNPVPGTLVDGQAVTCISPPSQYPGPVSVVVSTNGVDYNAISVTYEYNDTAILYSLYPMLGPYTGGTLLELYGANFRDSDGLSCKFTNIHNNDTNGGWSTYQNQQQQQSVVVLAEFHSQNHVSCITHAVEFESNQQHDHYPLTVYSVSVSDTAGWSSPLVFYYYEQPILEDVFPSAGPLSGGTNVTITFLYFPVEIMDYLDSNVIGIECIFGTTTSLSATILRAATSSDELDDGGSLPSKTLVLCESPPGLEPGDTNLSISLNGGVNYHPSLNTGLSYIYYQDPLISTISPRRGLITRDNAITISGLHLIGGRHQPMCRWWGRDDTEAVNATEVPATGDLVCVTTIPKTPLSSLSENEVQRVSLIPQPVMKEVQQIVSPQLSRSDEVQEIFIGGRGSQLHVQEIMVKVQHAQSDEEVQRLSTTVKHVEEVQTLTVGSTTWVPEVQRIYVVSSKGAPTPLIGTFRIKFGYYTGRHVNVGATASEIIFSLSDISSLEKGVFVSAGTWESDDLEGMYYEITITQVFGDVSQFEVDPSGLYGMDVTVWTEEIKKGESCEVQEVSIIGVELGTFSILLDGIGTTGQISWNATADELSEALSLLHGAGRIFVTKTTTSSSSIALPRSLQSWTIAFPDQGRGFGLLSIDSTLLEPIATSSARVWRLSPSQSILPSRSFVLSLNTSDGYQNETTPPISVDSPTWVIEEALLSLAPLSGRSVNVSSEPSSTLSSFVQWSITFPPGLDWPLLTGSFIGEEQQL